MTIIFSILGFTLLLVLVVALLQCWCRSRAGAVRTAPIPAHALTDLSAADTVMYLRTVGVAAGSAGKPMATMGQGPPAVMVPLVLPRGGGAGRLGPNTGDVLLQAASTLSPRAATTGAGSGPHMPMMPPYPGLPMTQPPPATPGMPPPPGSAFGGYASLASSTGTGAGLQQPLASARSSQQFYPGAVHVPPQYGTPHISSPTALPPALGAIGLQQHAGSAGSGSPPQVVPFAHLPPQAATLDNPTGADLRY
jgi:hypothetical protein